jgi:hypothetical protein
VLSFQHVSFWLSFFVFHIYINSSFLFYINVPFLSSCSKLFLFNLAFSNLCFRANKGKPCWPGCAARFAAGSTHNKLIGIPTLVLSFFSLKKLLLKINTCSPRNLRIRNKKNFYSFSLTTLEPLTTVAAFRRNVCHWLRHSRAVLGERPRIF